MDVADRRHKRLRMLSYREDLAVIVADSFVYLDCCCLPDAVPNAVVAGCCLDD